MITVDYFGRIGNNFFQYVMGRMVAKSTSQHLNTEWNHNEFIEIAPWNNKPDVVSMLGSEIVVDDERIRYPVPCESHIRLHGYFQDATFYNPYRALIKGLWKLPTEPKNKDDIVIHLRLTDYYWNNVTGHNDCVISPKWYLDILRKERYKKLYIVVEPHITNKHYLDQFSTLRPIIISGSPKTDFEFLLGFDRIVCSNSTFAWWAAFLSDASKIYLFKDWMGRNRINKSLVNMEGAIILDGEYIHNKRLGALDWRGYWDKSDSFFKGAI